PLRFAPRWTDVNCWNEPAAATGQASAGASMLASTIGSRRRIDPPGIPLERRAVGPATRARSMPEGCNSFSRLDGGIGCPASHPGGQVWAGRCESGGGGVSGGVRGAGHAGWLGKSEIWSRHSDLNRGPAVYEKVGVVIRTYQERRWAD